jgi:hypothetical protein
MFDNVARGIAAADASLLGDKGWRPQPRCVTEAQFADCQADEHSERPTYPQWLSAGSSERVTSVDATCVPTTADEANERSSRS